MKLIFNVSNLIYDTILQISQSEKIVKEVLLKGEHVLCSLDVDRTGTDFGEPFVLRLMHWDEKADVQYAFKLNVEDVSLYEKQVDATKLQSPSKILGWVGGPDVMCFEQAYELVLFLPQGVEEVYFELFDLKALNGTAIRATHYRIKDGQFLTKYSETQYLRRNIKEELIEARFRDRKAQFRWRYAGLGFAVLILLCIEYFLIHASVKAICITLILGALLFQVFYNFFVPVKIGYKALKNIESIPIPEVESKFQISEDDV